MVFKQRISGSCDYCILNFLHQVLMQTDGNDIASMQKQSILTQLKQVFEHLGMMVVTLQGQIQFTTQRADQLLSQYFSPSDPHSCPTSLQHWLDHQISLLTSKETVIDCCFPLHIEQAGKQLRVGFICELIGQAYLLLLEEEELPSFSITSLELLGLTQREAEVLFWVANDKSNASIARLLDCSQGTVRKHLEHIYRKLEVQTRTAAVVVALEKLGLLNGSFVAISS